MRFFASNTKFDLPSDVVPLSVRRIDPAVPGSSGSESSFPVATPSVSAGPNFVTVTGSKKLETANVKVVQATMKRLPNGKCEFTHVGQTFVNVIESNANVDYVTSVVQRRWGSDYVLVTADGLEMERRVSNLQFNTNGHCVEGNLLN